MARKANGDNILEVAKTYLSKAKTVAALRQAQAVVFPLAIEQTAEAIGVSPGPGMSVAQSFYESG